MRCSATAIERGEPSCTTRSTEPMSMPSSSDAVATTARSSPFLQALLGVEAQFARQAAVVRHHEAFAEALVRARTRRARSCGASPTKISVVRLRADLFGDAIVDLAPHLVARDRAELVVGNLDRELHLAAVPTSTIVAPSG